MSPARPHDSAEERRSAKRPGVHLAASLGGHLELLVRLRPHLNGYEPVWVTAAQDGADPVRSLGDRVVDLPRFNRSRPLSAVRNVWVSLVRAVRERPDVIVTSGAGSVVAFCVFGRLLGARVIFVETMARVTSPSASGRVLSRMARLVLVQWQEMARVYRNAVVCRPALWEDVNGFREKAPSPREDANGATSSRRGGTVVAVGTHRHQFDRLLEMVDRAVEAGILPGPVVAQTGHSTYRPSSFRGCDFFGTDELVEAVGQADYVVCHGGAGIIAAALRAGHKPLVLPRWADRQEHVDNHQVQIVDKLSSLGLVVPLDDEITPRHLAATKGVVPTTEEPVGAVPVSEVVTDELRRLVPLAA
jgi:UDP-N-acetylglucosamine--N-acetylmuramyl-(pentapeptide) pyrophosphoryl-undecaprenol N-acetylglucosamine transferase